MPEPLEDLLREKAEKPAEVSSDAGSVKQHKLSDLIELARYLAAKEAAQQPHRGLRLNKLVPPGASG